MSKPWDQKPLWWLVLMSDDRVYLEAARIIGHLGCGPAEFWDKAKALPNYDKYKLECAVRDLTVYARREPPHLRYELNGTAKKVCRVVLGPAPDDPEYRDWWERRLVSVRTMRGQGVAVTFAADPPVPLAPAKKPAPKKARKQR